MIKAEFRQINYSRYTKFELFHYTFYGGGPLNPPLKRPHYFQKPGYGPAHKHHLGTIFFSGE